MSRLLSSYLQLTPKGFFFRMRVPKHLQSKLNKREFKKAIATTDRVVAERQAILYAARVIEILDSLEGNLSDHVQKMVVSIGKAKIHIDPNRRDEELLSLKKLGFFAGADAAPIESYVASAAETAQVTPIDTNPINNSILLSEALDRYISNRIDEDEVNYTKEKQSALKSLFRRLLEDIGDLPLGKITSDDAAQFRKTLKMMPKVQTTQIRQNMTVKQLVALDDPKKLSANTVGQRLNTISSVFNWLNTKNKTIDNPFKGVRDLS